MRFSFKMEGEIAVHSVCMCLIRVAPGEQCLAGLVLSKRGNSETKEIYVYTAGRNASLKVRSIILKNDGWSHGIAFL